MDDPATPELIEALSSPDRAISRHACDLAIARGPKDPELLRAVTDLLARPSARTRFAAAFVLFRVRRPSLRLLPALLDALEMPDGDYRWEAAHMLVALGRMEPQVLPVLLQEAAGATAPARRRMALYAIRELSPEREEAEACFVRALDDPDPGVRRAGFASFSKLVDPSDRTFARALATLEADPDPRMRLLATVVVTDLVARFPEASARVEARLATLADPSTDAGRSNRGPEGTALARAAALALNRLRDGGGADRPDPEPL